MHGAEVVKCSYISVYVLSAADNPDKCGVDT